jgi:osmotically-inducible protein OsmY
MKQRSHVRLLLLVSTLTATLALAQTPAAERTKLAAATEPSITITEQRLGLDERIQANVMDVLARNPDLTGKVGVETTDQVVNLSGYLMTPGQVWRAGRDARGVQGVKQVVNEIRPRVGPVSY